MKFLSIVAIFLLLTNSAFCQDQKPKKEILVSISSNYYKNANGVIEGFFKQANITDFFIDEKIEKIERKNFQFKNKTIVSETVRCKKCKQKKCLINAMQTRSGDEAETIFITCTNCGYTSKS